MKNKKEYDNAWYAKNKERVGKKKVQQSYAIRKRNMQFVVNFLKKNPCIDCGESDFIVLEFDHLDSDTKVKTVCDMVRGSFSLQRIEEEISKCCVRCANCHRKKTAKDFNWYNGVV